ncbi:TPA: hypothetical protein DDW69_01380 [candidate division CPR2 bacterium]|uniref:Uncharacterized protein n=1 Tax=candidate division CPR2 bacterium GW2011_GWC1_41_48 TaxID=1618344 RepID=A0A0G0W9P5_UNCC2|nr:MAG: hypothetical protein UT47_C0001G0080 [candidate division CPR2 bacterium GW2011_GWC2_39_35]KKS09675.1 MAG: hypothetical protein UU65_C0001G0080 [candidate division CPR2 bacterium GW2011_GWC1_41_48]HBG81472.1 hypothetical protein [candidate division CPR2 bacterium]HCL99563.1 hypothetical protein [candidate division CPR2 bacterium]
MSKRRSKKKKIVLFSLTVVAIGYIYFASTSSTSKSDIDPMGAKLSIKNLKSEEIGPEDIKPELELGAQSEILPFKMTFKEPKGYEVKTISMKILAGNKIQLTPVAKRCLFCKAKKYTVEGEISNLVAGEWDIVTNYGGGL